MEVLELKKKFSFGFLWKMFFSVPFLWSELHIFLLTKEWLKFCHSDFCKIFSYWNNIASKKIFFTCYYKNFLGKNKKQWDANFCIVGMYSSGAIAATNIYYKIVIPKFDS